MKKKKKSVRDLWVYYSWHDHGVGPHRTRKKELPRKAKHKKSPIYGDFYYVNLVYIVV